MQVSCTQYTPRQATAATLPYDILLVIFPMTYDRHPEPVCCHYDPVSKEDITGFALVCKSWLDAARAALYTFVHLGQPVSAGLPETVALFKRTIYDSPSLASLVSRLEYGCYDFVEEPSETADFAAIIAACDNLQRLAVYAWHAEERKILVEAIKSRSKLVSLELSRFCVSLIERDYDRDEYHTYERIFRPFCDINELMIMLPSWPKLERLVLESHTVTPRMDEDGPESSHSLLELKLNACPRVKEFSISGCGITPQHLQALSSIMPSVATFGLSYSGRCTHPAANRHFELGPVLKTWSATLTSLQISDPSYVLELDHVTVNLPGLRFLDVTYYLIEPEHFRRVPPGLHHLRYCLERGWEEDVIDILQDASVLPRLKKISLRYVDISGNWGDILKGICQRRNLDYEIFCRDTYVPFDRRNLPPTVVLRN